MKVNPVNDEYDKQGNRKDTALGTFTKPSLFLLNFRKINLIDFLQKS